MLPATKPREAVRALAIAFALAALPALPAHGQATAAGALAQKFARADQTLEYHFMLKAPPFTEANREQVLGPLFASLKAFGEVGALKGPRDGAYIDSRERILEGQNLILRLRPGLVTVKARSTDLGALIDLKPCAANKWEQDYFEEVGYSVSSELPFKKEEWIADPTGATVRETLDFLGRKCPELAAQMAPIFKPIETMKAPGTARMYSAEFKLTHPRATELKEQGLSAWTFPGSTHTLVEIAWTGYVKDKVILDQIYQDVRGKLAKAGLLALDQSSKTEQYFQAYYGATALDTRYGKLAQPAYVKHFEADGRDLIVPSPYQQVGTRRFPAILDPSFDEPYDWVLDADGNLAVVPETSHPFGRVYDKGFLRPEDKSQKKPGTSEHYGHVTALLGLPGRISGELNYDKKTNTWSINNKSGRYSKNNADRTPAQLLDAAQAVRAAADIGGAKWGPVVYILEYGPAELEKALMSSPDLQYEDPAKKKRPYLILKETGGGKP